MRNASRWDRSAEQDVRWQLELGEQRVGGLTLLAGLPVTMLGLGELRQRQAGPGRVEARSHALEGRQRVAQPALRLAPIATGEGDPAQGALGQAHRPGEARLETDLQTLGALILRANGVAGEQVRLGQPALEPADQA